MSFRYRHNYSILNSLKRDFPGTKIVAGGPHISTFGKSALLDCSAIDIGVMMEGEKTFVEICKGQDPNQIAGIFYREDTAGVIQTGAPELIEDLDRVPFPKYEKFRINSYPRTISIVTSRGCPYQCIYCPIASVMGRGFRARSAANVVDEIEYWVNRGFKDFSIADDVFNFLPQRVYDICDDIEKRKLSGLRITCGNGIRADQADRALLQRMKEAGFYYLAFGVESANNNVLKTLKKGERIEKIEEAIKEACRLGFAVELFFLIGSPGETRQDVQQSIDFALKYPINNAKFYNLIPFPNTELYSWLEEKDYFLFPRPDYLDNIMHHVNKPLFATPELTVAERKKAFRYARRLIQRHTKRRRLEFENRLAKEKLRDYYGIRGFSANLIAWFYSHEYAAALIKLRNIFYGHRLSFLYNAERYWRKRFIKHGFNLLSVGDDSVSESENERTYLNGKEAFLSFCQEEKINFENSYMLDIGCGVGFYTRIFLEKGGKKYLGVDITDTLFDGLKREFPGFQFRKLDISAQPLEDKFDLIIMLDVTQHIINNKKFSFAMQNVKSHLKDQGVFIVSSWLDDRARHSFCETSRSIGAYKKEFPGYRFSSPVPFRNKFIFSIRK